jgi:hypothetical protein
MGYELAKEGSAKRLDRLINRSGLSMDVWCFGSSQDWDDLFSSVGKAMWHGSVFREGCDWSVVSWHSVILLAS